MPESYTEIEPKTASDTLVDCIVAKIAESGDYHDVHNFGDAFAKSVADRLCKIGFAPMEHTGRSRISSFEAHLYGYASNGTRTQVTIRSFYLLGFCVAVTAKAQ